MIRLPKRSEEKACLITGWGIKIQNPFEDDIENSLRAAPREGENS